MVPGLAEKADDLRISMRVKSRIRDNLLEEERRHKPGAGKSEKDAPLPEQLESEEVDVLVSAARPFELAAGFDKFRGVEDDEVELAAGFAVLSQTMEDIIFHIFYSSGVNPIQFRMEFRNLQGRTGRFDVGNLGCVGFECPDSKGSSVGETVEDFGASGEFLQGISVFPLIEIEPGFVPPLNIHKESARAFLDCDEGRWHFP
jgi:hypothetical protein